MNRDEMITKIRQEVKGLTGSLADDDYGNAIDAAQRDTGWTLPQTADFKVRWLLERTKRHLFDFLLSESASKFRYKNIHLQHRFDHYYQLIEKMDSRFEKAQEEYAYEFADVDAYQIGGTKIDAGFAYEPQTGRDHTYDDENQVILTPNEDS
jgi:hypothetical protein